MTDKLAAILVLAGLAFVLWLNPPKRATKLNSKPIETKHDYHLYRPIEDAVDREIRVSDGQHSARVFDVDGELRADVSNPDYFNITIREHEHFASFRTDLGMWGAGSLADETEQRFQYGLRYSPLRLFFDTVAADVVVSDESIGVGASAYPTPDSWGHPWHHAGIGAWYLVPFDDAAEPDFAIGLSFSILPH
jgi:hypothetical protein